MIDKLTDAQKAKIPEYVEQYKRIGLSTEPCNRALAEKAVGDSYEYLKLKRPTFMWCDSPQAGAKLAAQLAKGSDEVSDEEIQAQKQLASFGSFEAYWVAFYAFIAEQLPVEKDNLIDIVKEIVQNAGVYWTFEDVVVMTEKPVKIHMRDDKLHNPNGLAIEYKDGTGVFYLDGVRYPSLLAMEVEKASKK